MSKLICPLCGKPTRTQKGLKIHRTRKHERRVRKPTYTELEKALKRSESIRSLMNTYIVTHGLADVCSMLAKIAKDEEQKAKFEEYKSKFQALSKLVAHWVAKK